MKGIKNLSFHTSEPGSSVFIYCQTVIYRETDVTLEGSRERRMNMNSQQAANHKWLPVCAIKANAVVCNLSSVCIWLQCCKCHRRFVEDFQ